MELQELISTQDLAGFTGFEYATGQPTTLDLWWVGPLPADVTRLIAQSRLEVHVHAATVTEADLSSVAASLRAAAPDIEDSAIEVSLTQRRSASAGPSVEQTSRAHAIPPTP